MTFGYDLMCLYISVWFTAFCPFLFVIWPPEKAEAPLKIIIFFLESTLCGYSKLVPQHAWHRAKEQNLIWSSWAEKASKNGWKPPSFDFLQIILWILWCWFQNSISLYSEWQFYRKWGPSLSISPIYPQCPCWLLILCHKSQVATLASQTFLH